MLEICVIASLQHSVLKELNELWIKEFYGLDMGFQL